MAEVKIAEKTRRERTTELMEESIAIDAAKIDHSIEMAIIFLHSEIREAARKGCAGIGFLAEQIIGHTGMTTRDVSLVREVLRRTIEHLKCEGYDVEHAVKNADITSYHSISISWVPKEETK